MTIALLPDEYFDDLLVRMAHHSTAIEGNTLTQGETKTMLIDGYIPRAMNMREFHEVMNYKSFMPFLKESLQKSATIDIPFIKETHRLLCTNAIGGRAGIFKIIPNMIIGADFDPTPPYMVQSALHDWCLDLQAQLAAAKDEQDKLVAICRQHIRFEQIHPFSDGNGRVGRALVVYSCLLHHMPPAVIPVSSKQEYISYLNTDDTAGLLHYMQVLQTAEAERIQIFSQIQ